MFSITTNILKSFDLNAALDKFEENIGEIIETKGT